jgi:hypothetical protein
MVQTLCLQMSLFSPCIVTELHARLSVVFVECCCASIAAYLHCQSPTDAWATVAGDVCQRVRGECERGV